jgi:hypothetical protein
MDEKGKLRDDAIMVGLVAEGSGERLARSIEVFKKGGKKGMMLVEGIDIQLFRDVKEVWNTMKPTTIGRAEKTIEIICPIGCTSSTLLKVLEEGGVLMVCMLTRMRQPIGKTDEIWLAVPGYGEKVKHRQVEVESKMYILNETKRPSESERMEGCYVNYARGKKEVAVTKLKGRGGREIGGNIGGNVINEELSSLTTSNITITTGDTGDESTGMDKSESRSMNTIQDIVENGRKEMRDMGMELREEMAVMARKSAEQSNIQEKTRIEEAQKQNRTLEDLRDMMMAMMTASAKQNI